MSKLSLQLHFETLLPALARLSSEERLEVMGVIYDRFCRHCMKDLTSDSKRLTCYCMEDD